MFCEPFLGVCSSCVWMRYVPDDIQGRVFSFRDLVQEIVQLLTLWLIGITADYVDSQLKEENGKILWATSFLFPGKSPGVRLIFVLSGVILAFFSLVAFLFGPKEEKEKEIVEEEENNEKEKAKEEKDEEEEEGFLDSFEKEKKKFLDKQKEKLE
mmetsp:Transcript_7665/g.11581  ORF Transcript_7665/g.11581 Transcript_7665/m.11581 type:complete len:155 (-) Transcript_7665:28-492(-)